MKFKRKSKDSEVKHELSQDEEISPARTSSFHEQTKDIL